MIEEIFQENYEEKNFYRKLLREHNIERDKRALIIFEKFLSIGHVICERF